MVCDLPKGFANFSGTWSAENIVLLGGTQGGLLRVSGSGGELMPETELDESRKELIHSFPSFLPDGRHYFYLASSAGTLAAFVGTLGVTEQRPLPGIRSWVKYSSGHVVFARERTLMAQPFDINRLELTGDAFEVAGLAAGADELVFPAISVSPTGSLAYAISRVPSQLAWFDRRGTELARVGPAGEYVGPDLSPDGKYVAFHRGDPADIWVLELENGRIERFTGHPARDTYPHWSPDGGMIGFSSNRHGTLNLYARAFGVVGEDTPIVKPGEVVKILSSWKQGYMSYVCGNDVCATSLSGDQSELHLTNTPFAETYNDISPDGRWIIYQSRESGQDEVVLQSFPQPSFKRQVSTAGGAWPRWSPNGKELFYVAPDYTLMAVEIKPTGGSLGLGAPTALFQMRFPGRDRNYAVSADGRFLVNLSVGNQAPGLIRVFLNWAAGLTQR